MSGILGKKIAMSQMYDQDGKLIPVTLIEAVPSEVLMLRTRGRNGYSAVQLGICDKKKVGKNTPKKKFIREVRMNADPQQKVGDVLKADTFQIGDYVDVSGVSKGKGFQGGMKRHGWKGGESGHGSMFHRRVGSIGASSFPSRVHKGKTMPGHMGNQRKTVQNLRVMKVDADNNVLVIGGSIPGSRNSFVVIRDAVKKPKKVEKGNEAKK